MMGDGDGDNISMISEADSQMSVNTAAAATRLSTFQDFLYELGIKKKEFHVDKVGFLTILPKNQNKNPSKAESFL